MGDHDDGSNVGRRTIGLDFDGTLHAYSRGWHDGTIYDGPMPGAIEACEQLAAEGYELVVFTARDVEGIAAWLEQHGFPAMTVTNTKPIAVAYIDDRAITFRGSWTDAIDELHERFGP